MRPPTITKIIKSGGRPKRITPPRGTMTSYVKRTLRQAKNMHASDVMTLFFSPIYTSPSINRSQASFYVPNPNPSVLGLLGLR